jgi:hypothetical protein
MNRQEAVSSRPSAGDLCLRRHRPADPCLRYGREMGSPWAFGERREDLFFCLGGLDRSPARADKYAPCEDISTHFAVT